MKILTIALILVSWLNSFGQNRPAPSYYLNSDLIDIGVTYINPFSIDSIIVGHKTENGEILIKTKSGLDFLDLDFVLRNYTDIEDRNNVVYVIDDKIVTKKGQVKIDKTYFIYVRTKELIDVDNIDKKFKKLVLIEIDLSSEKIKPKISIRGNELVGNK